MCIGCEALAIDPEPCHTVFASFGPPPKLPAEKKNHSGSIRCFIFASGDFQVRPECRHMPIIRVLGRTFGER